MSNPYELKDAQGAYFSANLINIHNIEITCVKNLDEDTSCVLSLSQANLLGEWLSRNSSGAIADEQCNDELLKTSKNAIISQLEFLKSIILSSKRSQEMNISTNSLNEILRGHIRQVELVVETMHNQIMEEEYPYDES